MDSLMPLLLLICASARSEPLKQTLQRRSDGYGEYAADYDDQYSEQHVSQYTGQHSNHYAGQQHRSQYAGQHTNQYAGQHANQYAVQQANQYAGQYANQYAVQHTNQNAGQHANQYAGQHASQYTSHPTGQYGGQNAGQYTGQYGGPPVNQYTGQLASQHTGQIAIQPAGQPAGYEQIAYAALSLHSPIPVLHVLSRVPLQHAPAIQQAAHSMLLPTYAPQQSYTPPYSHVHEQQAEESAVLYARPNPRGGYTYRRRQTKPRARGSRPTTTAEPVVIRVHRYRVVRDR